MGNLPNISVGFSNGNLLEDIVGIDGEAAFIGTGTTEGNLNKVFIVNSLLDAVGQGITQEAEPTAYRHISEFYAELAGNMESFWVLVANTVTMAQMVAVNDLTKASVLIAAGNGIISYLGVFRTPPVDYDGGDDFIDADVAAAITAATGFTTAQNAQNLFFTTHIEGRVIIANEASNTIFAPNTADSNFSGVVLGGSLADGSASVGCALGRKVKYAAQIKVGDGQNGPLAIQTVYIGTKLLAAVTNLDALAGKGYLVFMTRTQRAGFFFGIDYMANTGDYSIWARGAIVNAAAKVAIDVYIDDLEGEVDTNPDGTILDLDATHLENLIIAQENLTLGNRISGFTAQVDRTANIVATSTTPIKLRVQPKGYNSFMTIDLGLTA